MRKTILESNTPLVKKAKRKGRGTGSGAGAKSGRGQKGQHSRTGSRILAAFEGGQTSFVMQIPKLKGFKPLNKVHFVPVNLGALEVAFKDGDVVDKVALLKAGLLRNPKSKVKILSKGELTKKLTIKVEACSESAKKNIEKLGGAVELL